MRIGYSFWGHLGNRLHDTDSPSGVAWYLWTIFNTLQEAGHEVFLMQEDRDYHGVEDPRYSNQYWRGYERDNRAQVWGELSRQFPVGADYRRIKSQKDLAEYLASMIFPDLDLLFLEWRWPLGWRNIDPQTGRSDTYFEGYHPDLEVQRRLIDYYSERGVQIFAWDLDHGFNHEVDSHSVTRVFEPSIVPLGDAESLFMPHDLERVQSMSSRHLWKYGPETRRQPLVYIGSRYDRDDHLNKWMAPFCERHRYGLELWGNWRKYSDDFNDALLTWPNFKYMDRVHQGQFVNIYTTAFGVPLLARPSYRQCGFMTNRLLESIYFGAIPIGFDDFNHIDKFLPDEVICTDNDDPQLRSLQVEQCLSMAVHDPLWVMSQVLHRVDALGFDVSHWVKVVLG